MAAAPASRKSHRRVRPIVAYNGRHMYLDLQEELSANPPPPLTDFDPVFIEVAKAWAKKNHKKWPPRPRPYPIQFWKW